jgi:hypothetical protein
MNQNPTQYLEIRKANFARRQLLESTWKQRMAQGITVGGLTLRCDEIDRNAFSQLLVMIAEAERLEQLPALVPVTDRSGQIHMKSVEDLRILLLAYGNAYQSLWVQKAQFHAAIEQAASVEALNAITINFT